MTHPLMEILSEYGYSTQRQVARALHEKVDYYKQRDGNPKTTAVFFNQIVLGRRPMPQHMAQGLAKLCNDDPRINEFTVPKEKPKAELSLQELYLEMLDRYYHQLREHTQKIPDKERLEVLTDLEQLVRKYTH